MSGDLSNMGNADSYRAVGAAMAGLRFPVVYALGNHDDPTGYRDGVATDGGSGPAFGEHLIDGLHVVALDTSVWDTVDAASTDRLAALLRASPPAAILSGHIHFDRAVILEGVPVATVPGQHAAAGPLHGGGLRAVRGASSALCRLRASSLAVTFVRAASDRAELKRLLAAPVETFE